MGVYAHSMLQVFGVDEQEPLCVSRLAGADQRQRITPQWSGTGDGGKHGHLEREVEAPNTSEAVLRRRLFQRPHWFMAFIVSPGSGSTRGAGGGRSSMGVPVGHSGSESH